MDSCIRSGYLEIEYKYLTEPLLEHLGQEVMAPDKWELWPLLSAYRMGDVVRIEVFINNDKHKMDISYNDYQVIPDYIKIIPTFAYLT